MLRRAGVITSVSVLLLMLGASSAHALALVAIAPSSGAVVTHSPTQVVLTFDGALGEQGNSITVTDASGKRIDDGSLEVSGARALVGITTLTSTGVMTIDFQVVGVDGVSLEGSSNFKVADSALATPSATATNSFWSNLKSGGSGILLGVLLLTVLLSRLARRKRR